MLKHTRPHKVLNLVNSNSYFERMVQILLPDENTKFFLIEAGLLIALAKRICPQLFFEFGTYLGEQLLNIAANLPYASKLYTLDLD